MKTAIHPSGLKINFDEDKHQYKDDNGKVYFSTTKVIHSLFPKFDAETIAGFVARKRRTTRDDILKEWEDKRNASADFGTEIHTRADNILRGFEYEDKPTVLTSSKLILYTKQISKITPKLLNFYELIESEKIIFSPDFRISGTLDVLMRNKKTNKLSIFDWKTNERIVRENTHDQTQTGLYNLSHINDCNFYQYALQLNVYRLILIKEKYYSDIDYDLAIFHIRENEVIPYNLPLLEKEAEYILSVSKNPIQELLEDCKVVDD